MSKFFKAYALSAFSILVGCSDTVPVKNPPVIEQLPPLTFDMTYGEDGLARAYRAHSIDQVFASAILSDGGILNGGSTGLGTYEGRADALLAKFDAMGQIDLAYGVNGFAILPLDDDARITSIAALPDGGALIAGVARRLYDRIDAFVAHVDAKGVLDTSFGTGGMTRLEIPYAIASGTDLFVPMARGAAGEIAVLTIADKKCSLWRLDAKGQVDQAFGTQGLVTVEGEFPRDLAFEPDGSLLVLTTTQVTSRVTRVKANGTFDSAFGTNGVAELTIEAYDFDRNAAGKLVVAGAFAFGRLIVLDAQGKPDTTFGSNGVADIGIEGAFLRAAWLPSGEIVASKGWVSLSDGLPVTYSNGLMKVSSTGSQISFSYSAGDIAASGGGNVAALLVRDAVVYMSGAHIAGNMAELREVFTFAMNPDGSGVSTFGTDGLAQRGSDAAPEVLGDMARAPDGSLVASGNGLVVRFDGGKQILGFGNNGFVESTSTAWSRIAIDLAGRIVVAGPDHRVSRYLENGAVDATFGVDGVATFSQGNGSARGIAIDPKGRIVVTGDVENQGALVARLLDDGTLDATFGNAGVVVGVSNSNFDFDATPLLAEESGKIVIAGNTMNSSMFIARFSENGLLDTSFASTGFMELSGNAVITRIVSRSDGGYLAAGGSGCYTQANCPVAVFAIEDAGTLDDAFGIEGVAFVGSGSTWSVGLDELVDGTIAVAGAIEDEVTKTERLGIWRLAANGTIDETFGTKGTFSLPIKSRATVVLADDQGFTAGGWVFNPKSGTDMVTLRFSF